jgi:hypothetical protein
MGLISIAVNAAFLLTIYDEFTGSGGSSESDDV